MTESGGNNEHTHACTVRDRGSMEIGISVVRGRVGREQDRCCCLGENKRERKEDDGGQVLWRGRERVGAVME